MDIKKEFENKFITKRIEFIESHDFFNDIENRDYFIDFIKNNTDLKDNWYSIKLIELATDLEIKDNDLMKAYLNYLTLSYSSYFKLTILDYISNVFLFYEKEDIDYSPIKDLLTRKHDRLIIKNQALLILSMIYPVDKDIYQKALLKNIKKTKDYRGHIRVYSTIINCDLENFFSYDVIKSLIKETKAKSLTKYRSVQEILKHVEEYLEN